MSAKKSIVKKEYVLTLPEWLCPELKGSEHGKSERVKEKRIGDSVVFSMSYHVFKRFDILLW